MQWLNSSTKVFISIVKGSKLLKTSSSLNRISLPFGITHSCTCLLSCDVIRYKDIYRLPPFYNQYRTMSQTVHSTAKEGFQEGAFYDQNRPSYTDEVVSRVCENLYREKSEGIRYHVLEMGAGTGKFTRKVLEKLDKPCSYLATEPSESFLSVLKDTVPEAETMVCTADKIPLPDNSVQNIICAQCFHWFATEECLQEMTRVLVPEGRIFLVWNNKQWSLDWIKETEKVLTQHYDNTPRAITKEWKKVIEGFKPLTLVEHKMLPGMSNMKGDKKFVVDHFSSISVIARLEPDKKTEAQTQFRAVLDKYFTSDEEMIQIPFESEYYCVKKT